ncbi:hypothetical protein ENBRE01_0956 [Enteropsectra breve]|nr:hypothetical protein ENBRE01_0956 [Enteropsectra breve]
MKAKNIKTISTHINYLYRIAVETPYRSLAKKKCMSLKALAEKNQLKLKEMKKTICKSCFSILIPKLTCKTQMVKKECGFGFENICTDCNNTTFTVYRSYKHK